MGGEKTDRVAGDPHRRLRVNGLTINGLVPTYENN